MPSWNAIVFRGRSVHDTPMPVKNSQKKHAIGGRVSFLGAFLLGLPFIAIGLIAWGAAAIYWPAAPIVTGLWLLFDLYRSKEKTS